MANNIKELRTQHGMTQAELAKRLDLTTSAVGMYETGARNPSYEILIKLSNIFNVSLEKIVDISIESSDESAGPSLNKSEVVLTELSYQTFQLEYIHPQKVRAKIKKKFRVTAIDAAQKVQKAIQYLLNNDSFHHPEMKEIAKNSLLKDENYRGANVTLDDLPLVDGIISLFYEDIKDSKEKPYNVIEKAIKLPKDAPRVIFLGRVGVGKSTIIKNITNFGDKINFPFTDTSRTTTYQTEYIFKNLWQDPNKFAVSFMSMEEVTQEVESAIDRAIEACINAINTEDTQQELIKSSRKESEQDRIIRAFYTEPNKVFDLRFLLGKYLKTDSKNRNNDNYQNLNHLWSSIYDYILTIFSDIQKTDFTSYNNDSQHNIPTTENQEFLRRKYYEYVLDSYNYEQKDKYSTYTRFKQFVLTEIRINISNLLMNLERNNIILSRNTYKNFETDWPLGFSCIIDDYDSEYFYDFIKIFTSKDGSDFGKILTPLVKEMRIELPYNHKLSDEITENPIVFIDTVGTSHVVDESSSIENSINLNLDSVDIITVVDDSKTSMSADTLNILKHLTHRVARSKIFIAYTFYDEFNKKEFIDDFEDDEDELDNQKQDYLLDLQRSKISALLKDDRTEINRFLNQLEDKTTFMNGLANKNIQSNEQDCISINNYLYKIHNYYNLYNNYLLVEKIDSLAPIVEYDYKRLAMIFFNEILESYLEQQRTIYLKKIPHHKVTEALTKRLANGETSYVGAEILKPVDDLYSIMLDNLYSFILNPKTINFKKDESNGNDYKIRLLEKLKETIFENLTQYLRDDFTSYPMKETWKKLYLDFGIGSDYRRRTGIIEALNKLLVPYTEYLSNPEIEHMIDQLELLFDKSIVKLENAINSEKEKIKK